MNRADQIKKTLGIVGAFFFGTDKERNEQAQEIAEAADQKIAEHRFRRAINAQPGGVDGPPPTRRKERER